MHLFTVTEVAKAWGISPARLRQLISEKRVIPEYSTEEPRYYWSQIPERENHADDTA